MKNLPINIDKFGFVEREKIDSKHVTNKCGRDFLYYGLHYYFPTKFNPENINPITIDSKRLFGFKLPSWMMWTQLQFFYLPNYLKENNVKLSINEKEIKSFLDFVIAILFSRMTNEKAIKTVEMLVDSGVAVGIDISLKYYGLLDHVMFVYGYDEDNFYVFDTHHVHLLEYHRMTTDNRFYMRLPKSIVTNRWSKFGRVWELKRS
jgi:hypothetical protein